MYSAWDRELPLDHPKRDYILQGVAEGFHITDPSKLTDYQEVENYKSATGKHHRELVEKKIKEELRNRRYKIVTKKPLLVSALGAIPKPGKSAIRIIHDASRPKNSSLNDHAWHEPFSYQRIQDAVDIIKPGYFLAKVDLAAAYRSVKIHESNHVATGLKWTFARDGAPTYMVDTRLPFGAKRSCEIFNDLGQAVRDIMRSHGYPSIVNYLDDFLVIGESYGACKVTLDKLLALLRHLGFAINYDKVAGPVQRITFLGIVLDSISMSLELPEQKLIELKDLLVTANQAKKLTKRQLQSLAGKLNWASQCIQGGRTFMRRILNAIPHLRAPWHRIRVNKDMRDDLVWWLTYLQPHNGTTPMCDNRPVSPIWTDACPVAAGCVYNGRYLYTPFNTWDKAADLHINYKETMALEPAVTHWAPHWANRRVIVYCDNQAAVGIINKGTCRDPVVMAALRRIAMLSARHNFRIQATYYPGSENIVADAISRLHEPRAPQRLQSAILKHLDMNCVPVNEHPVLPATTITQ